MKDSEIKALIQLLDDPDPLIYERVSSKLFEEGFSLLPYLEASVGLTDNDLLNERIRGLIDELHSKTFFTEFEEWCSNEERKPLIYGLFFINLLYSPDLEFSDFKEDFDRLRKQVWLELNNNLTGFEAIKVLNQLFYTLNGYKVETERSDKIANHFTQNLFYSKTASHFAFVGVYVVLAQSLDLPVFPVYLPGLLIMAYENAEVAHAAYGNENNDVLFYINPYDNGAFLGRKALDYVVEKKKIPAEVRHYKSISNIDFVSKYLRYLRNVLPQENSMLEKINRMIDIIRNSGHIE